jgi:hypothetical protein
MSDWYPKSPGSFEVEFLGESGDRPEGDWVARTDAWPGYCVVSGTPEGAIAELRIAYYEHHWREYTIELAKKSGQLTEG